MSPTQAAQLRNLIATASEATAQAAALMAGASDEQFSQTLDAVTQEHGKVSRYISGLTESTAPAAIVTVNKADISHITLNANIHSATVTLHFIDSDAAATLYHAVRKA